jgi:hypothetical protein
MQQIQNTGVVLYSDIELTPKAHRFDIFNSYIDKGGKLYSFPDTSYDLNNFILDIMIIAIKKEVYKYSDILLDYIKAMYCNINDLRYIINTDYALSFCNVFLGTRYNLSNLYTFIYKDNYYITDNSVIIKLPKKLIHSLHLLASNDNDLDAFDFSLNGEVRIDSNCTSHNIVTIPDITYHFYPKYTQITDLGNHIVHYFNMTFDNLVINDNVHFRFNQNPPESFKVIVTTIILNTKFSVKQLSKFIVSELILNCSDGVTVQGLIDFKQSNQYCIINFFNLDDAFINHIISEHLSLRCTYEDCIFIKSTMMSTTNINKNLLSIINSKIAKHDLLCGVANEV